MSGPLATASGLLAAAAAGSAMRSHGDMFLTADRKNRMEKQRLDQQLKAYETDWARQEFCIDREKKAVILKWKGMAMTTGHSDKALPPNGPQDNVYKNSKHSQNRLSEKRLIQWKVHERNLEKFLRQFEPKGLKTYMAAINGQSRPISSRPSSGRPTRPSSERRPRDPNVPPRCKSAVGFSEKMAIDGTQEEEYIVDMDEEVSADTNRKEENDRRRSSTGYSAGRLGGFQTGLKSLSAAQFYNYHHYYSSKTTRRGSSPSTTLPLKTATKVKPLDDSQITDITEKTEPVSQSHPFSGISQQPSPDIQTAELHKTTTRDYQNAAQSTSSSSTKFFETKNNVVVTSDEHQTYRHLHDNDDDNIEDDMIEPSAAAVRFQANYGAASDIDNTTKAHNFNGENGNHHLDPKNAVSPGRISISSSNSIEDLEDNVFITAEEQTDPLPNESNNCDVTVTDIEGSGKNEYVDNSAHDREVNTSSRHCSASESKKPAFVRVARFTPENNVKSQRKQPEASLASNMNRLAFNEVQKGKGQKHNSRANDRYGQGNCKKSQRETMIFETVNPPLHRQSFHVVSREPTASAPSKSLLLKRSKSGAVLFTSPSDLKEKTSPSSLTSAMNVTHLRTSAQHAPETETTKSPPTNGSTTMQTDRQDNGQLPRMHGSYPRSISSNGNNNNNNGVGDNKPATNGENSATETSSPKAGCPSPKSSISTLSASSPTAGGPSLKNSIGTNTAATRTNSDSKDSHSAAPSGDKRAKSQWRRDEDLENPAGLRTSVSSLSTVIRAAMVFSKTARKRALRSMVDENNVNTREGIQVVSATSRFGDAVGRFGVWSFRCWSFRRQFVLDLLWNF